MAEKKIDALRKENCELLKNVKELNKNFQALKELQSKMASDSEIAKSLQGLSDEYEDLKRFKSNFRSQLDNIASSLDDISRRIHSIEDSIEAIDKYSYQYNIKIIGIPQTSHYETTEKTSEICVDLVNKISATNVTMNDIDIAHRIPNRQEHSTGPPAIVCKFTRRIAKEQVMNRKKNVRNITAQDLKIWPVSPMKVMIFEHLTPKMQELLKECKTFQRDHGYKYCWVKRGSNAKN